MKTRENYYYKLVNYMKSFYNTEHGLNKLEDGRVNPIYTTAQVVTPVLLGFLLRVKSFNVLDLMIKAKEFDKLFPNGTKLPGIDAIRDTLKVIAISGLRQMNYHLIKKSVANKVFDNGTIDGYTVAAIDGTKFFGSNKKRCAECLQTNNHNFNSGAVIVTVGDRPKLVLDFEMYRLAEDSVTKDEGEQTVSKRLLSNVVNDHNGFIDVVVYDALVCNSVWFNHCVELGVDTVVRAKKILGSEI